MKTKNDLLKEWQLAYNTPFSGWDFSLLEGHWRLEDLPWNYDMIIKKYIMDDQRILDMGTGGGEYLLTLKHPNHNTSVTEGYLPNYKICVETLAPLGIEVKFVEEDDKLAFPNNYFDCVINRHESYDLNEVYRVLKPGSYFITQQVGYKNNQDLTIQLLGTDFQRNEMNTLAVQRHLAINAGFTIIEEQESFAKMRFYDIAALVYYAKIISWEFPNFSVDNHCNHLMRLYHKLEEKGYISSTEHRYLLVLRK
ncbi:MAG TPA: class I SAM-dependent methyltransferase [Erysipelothrix sp.]